MRKFLYSLLFLGSVFFVHASSVNAQACPLADDTITSSDLTNPTICKSAKSTGTSYTGFNVVGATLTCGQVNCPGKNLPGFARGHTCIIKQGNTCYPGTGASGFFTDPTFCTQDPRNVPVTCPTPLNLTIQVKGAQPGMLVSGITFTIYYEDLPPGNTTGKTYQTQPTDPSGIVVVSGVLYSGDHFRIVPNNIPTSFTPLSYGGTVNLGDQEMNTPWSCGTSLTTGGANQPCTFTLGGQSAGTACTGVKTSINGFCKPGCSDNEAIDGTCQQTGENCCVPNPNKPNKLQEIKDRALTPDLFNTLVFFGAIALIGLFL